MKQLLSLVLLCMLLTACCKDKPDDPDDMNVPGLPPVTQTGQNTLGFLLKGQPWTPEGNNGTANLSIDYDPGINNGIVGISGYRVLSPGNVQEFGLGITDSLNLKTVPFTLQLNRTSLYRFRFWLTSSCYLLSIDSQTYSDGSITITRHDRTAGIIAGTFEATLYKAGCDTIRITKGRFDMRF